MQAIRRRVKLATRQTKKRSLRHQNKKRHEEGKERFLESQQQKGLRIKERNEALRIRKEDYELGPIAPWRKAGKDAERYGTVNTGGFMALEVPKWKRKWCGIEVGDRVVMLKGLDKGKIGVVTRRQEESETIMIKDLNTFDAFVPEFLRKHQGTASPTGTYSAEVSWHDVRLVYPMEHPVTGVPRDVIVENLERREVEFDPDTLESEYERVIPELDFVVPSPKQDEGMFKDRDDDTLRIDVEQRTWLPTLNEPPFPTSVIDELRNKYSKYRIPDNDRFVKHRERAEEGKEKRNIKWMHSMRTPLQELHALQAAKKRQELREKGLEAQMPAVEIKRGKPWKWKSAPREVESVDEQFLERLGSMLAEKRGVSAEKATA